MVFSCFLSNKLQQSLGGLVLYCSSNFITVNGIDTYLCMPSISIIGEGSAM